MEIIGSVMLLGSVVVFYGIPFLILRSLLNNRLRQRDDRITELEFRIRTLENRLLAAKPADETPAPRLPLSSNE